MEKQKIFTIILKISNEPTREYTGIIENESEEKEIKNKVRELINEK